MSLARERKSPGCSRGNGASVQAWKGVVEEEAGARLRCSAYGDIRGVTCEFHEGVLTLRGRVPSYYMKQIAQSLVLGMEGAEEINNRLEVELYGRNS
ncbi:BON domain-containing protein [Planctomycetota bacterium]